MQRTRIWVSIIAAAAATMSWDLWAQVREAIANTHPHRRRRRRRFLFRSTSSFFGMPSAGNACVFPRIKININMPSIDLGSISSFFFCRLLLAIAIRRDARLVALWIRWIYRLAVEVSLASAISSFFFFPSHRSFIRLILFHPYYLINFVRKSHLCIPHTFTRISAARSGGHINPLQSSSACTSIRGRIGDETT